MKSRNGMKKLGVFAVIVMILVCAAALAVAVMSFLGGGESPVRDILGGVLIEKEQNPKLTWQTGETEGDVTAVIKTDLGEIVFKLDGSKAAERFIESAGDFGGASFETVAENLFIQVPALTKNAGEYEENELGCFYGAVGFVSEDGKVSDSLVIITAKELSGISKAYVSGENFDLERGEFYESFGGVPEYEGKIQVFGQVIDGFGVLEKIAAAETSGYTGGYAAENPVEIISVTVRYPKPEGQLE